MSGSDDMNWSPVDAEIRKFTDRDVRDNPGYYEVALKYVRQYTGEFEFLIDLKMRDASGIDFSPGHVRGVLNCMRIDPRVEMPDEAELAKLNKKVRKGKKGKSKKRHLASVTPIKQTCDLMEKEDHGSHWMPDSSDRREWCPGWYRINRGLVETKARFHAPFVRSTNSNLIHRNSHEGRLSWFVPRHEYGHGRVTFWYVRTACPIQDLTNPILLDKAGVLASSPLDRPSMKQYAEITLCARCFPEGEL